MSVRLESAVGFAAVVALCLQACGPTDEHVADLDSADPGKRQAAAYQLLLKGNAAVPALIALVDTGADNSRFIATQLLGKIGDPRAVEPLLVQLQQAQETALRQAAAEALGKLGDERAISPLIRALTTDTKVVVRQEAIQALTRLRHTEVSVYAAALSDWHPEVRRGALLALVQFVPDGLQEFLLQLADDPDPSLRYLVVQLLPRIEPAAAVPVLIHALEDNTGAVRQEAALALGRLKATDAREALIDLVGRSTDSDGDAARQALLEITGIDFVPFD